MTTISNQRKREIFVEQFLYSALKLIQIIVASAADCVVEVSKWENVGWFHLFERRIKQVQLTTSLPGQCLLSRPNATMTLSTSSNRSVLCEHPAPAVVLYPVHCSKLECQCGEFIKLERSTICKPIYIRPRALEKVHLRYKKRTTLISSSRARESRQNRSTQRQETERQNIIVDTTAL